MLNDEELFHLRWIINRIIYKYGDSKNDEHIVRLEKIIEKLYNKDINISDDSLNMILGKYFVDFSFDKSEFLGFTEQERDLFRKQIRGICKDIMLHNFS